MGRSSVKAASVISSADFRPRRQTRAFATSLQAFTHGGAEKAERAVKREESSDDVASLSSIASDISFDIEDGPLHTKKRKRGFDTPSTAVLSVSTIASTRTSPRKLGVKEEIASSGKARKAKRQPAKRIVNEDGEEEVQAPANWEEIYEAVREMRKEKLAPVDTMGCETLAEEHLTPRVSCSDLARYPPRSDSSWKIHSGQTLPDFDRTHAFVANQGHHQCNRHAQTPNRTSTSRSYIREHIRSRPGQAKRDDLRRRLSQQQNSLHQSRRSDPARSIQRRHTRYN